MNSISNNTAFPIVNNALVPHIMSDYCDSTIITKTSRKYNIIIAMQLIVVIIYF